VVRLNHFYDGISISTRYLAQLKIDARHTPRASVFWLDNFWTPEAPIGVGLAVSDERGKAAQAPGN
jgi:hypothetical protein